MISDVAVLYCDRLGPYPKLVEHWYDEARDARTYAGPWPVVAHPPCGAWSSLRHLHTQPQERDLFGHALHAVTEFGGVLEHPARSRAFEAHGIRPTVEVQQCDWGHPARKRTWLYLVGCQPGPMPPTREPTHWCSGGRKRSSGSGGLVPPGIKICSAQQRRRTPMAFAVWLVDLARTAGRAALKEGEKT